MAPTPKSCTSAGPGIIDDRPDKSRQIINERVEEIAKKRGVSMAQVGLAWSLGHPDITAPIVGTTKLDNLTELIAYASLMYSLSSGVSSTSSAPVCQYTPRLKGE
jgi:aryl-alcohol dehydrogenase-like predicted oxidoreductase